MTENLIQVPVEIQPKFQTEYVFLRCTVNYLHLFVIKIFTVWDIVGYAIFFLRLATFLDTPVPNFRNN
jgi:hypothetical protein